MLIAIFASSICPNILSTHHFCPFDSISQLQEDVHWRTPLGDKGWYMHYSTYRRIHFNYKLPDDLRDYFSQYGKVDACTIMRDAAGRSRCFAFLTFEDPASVNAVMVREHVLDGKIVCLFSYPSMYGLTNFFRSTLNELFLDKSTNAPLNFSLEV